MMPIFPLANEIANMRRWFEFLPEIR